MSAFFIVKMTINMARKVLGILSKGITDAQIESDIRSAELLKNLFFESKMFQESKTHGKPQL